MKNEDRELDPEFLDVLIQAISVLSNVATLASTWFVLRARPATHPAGGVHNIDNIRHNLRLLRRGLEDTFESVESVLRILEEARARHGQPQPLSHATRFGTAVMLSGEEFAAAQNALMQLESAATQARQNARLLIFQMNSTNMQPTFNLQFDPETFYDQLNSALFESPTLAEAMTKLRLVQQQAEDFVSEIERALRGN
jgi:hypothetical protein